MWGWRAVTSFDRKCRDNVEARLFFYIIRLQPRSALLPYSTHIRSDLQPLPEDIPADPYGLYKDKGWVGYGEWLGSETVATFNQQYREFEVALQFVHPMGLKNTAAWQLYW